MALIMDSILMVAGQLLPSRPQVKIVASNPLQLGVRRTSVEQGLSEQLDPLTPLLRRLYQRLEEKMSLQAAGSWP